MADAVIAGASDSDIDSVQVVVRDALAATPDDVLAADGYLFGTPENFGYMSGALKVFFDRCFYACVDQVNGRPYGLFIRAGNDGQGALSSVQRIIAGWALREVTDPVLFSGDFDGQRLGECKELGQTLAFGLDAGVF